MSVATFTKYLLKALVISCTSVKLQQLSKILNGATYLSMYPLSHSGCFENNL